MAAAALAGQPRYLNRQIQKEACLGITISRLRTVVGSAPLAATTIPRAGGITATLLGNFAQPVPSKAPGCRRRHATCRHRPTNHMPKSAVGAVPPTQPAGAAACAPPRLPLRLPPTHQHPAEASLQWRPLLAPHPGRNAVLNSGSKLRNCLTASSPVWPRTSAGGEGSGRRRRR